MLSKLRRLLQWLQPYRAFECTSALSPAELQQQLKHLVDEHTPLRFNRESTKSTKPYSGTIWKSSFLISIITQKPSRGIPITKGTVTEHSTGSTVSVVMRLHIWETIFLIFSMLLACFFMAVFYSFNFFIGQLLMIALILWEYLSEMHKFHQHANQTEKDLRELLEAGG